MYPESYPATAEAPASAATYTVTIKAEWFDPTTWTSLPAVPYREGDWVPVGDGTHEGQVTARRWSGPFDVTLVAERVRSARR